MREILKLAAALAIAECILNITKMILILISMGLKQIAKATEEETQDD